MEVVGLDTGFFTRLLKKNPQAVRIWKQVIGGRVRAITSVLVLFELKRLLHRINEIQKWEELREAIIRNCDVVPVDVEIAERGASISHGTGLPAVDALIYTSLQEAEIFYTIDRSFELFEGKRKPKIVFL